MKKYTDESHSLLAAEYVLGTLKGAARRRFERWMVDSMPLRQEVWLWEALLGGLADQVAPVEPPVQIAARLQARLWPMPASVSSLAERRHRRSAGLWKSWSLVATAASIVLALTLVLKPVTPAATEWVAVVQSSEAAPLWTLNAANSHGRFELKAVGAGRQAASEDFELWILPGQGAPISMGVMPVDGGRLTIQLSPEAMQSLLESRQLAISLEPRGGSPTGAPTGPVVYTSRLLPL